MSEPVNWIDRVDGVMGWFKDHPSAAKLLGGIVIVVVGYLALAHQINTTGHE